MHKKLILAAAAVLFAFGTTVMAQVVKVPDNAKETFAKAYPKAKNVKWHNNVANYDADFKDGNDVCTAHFNVDGTWKFTEKHVNKSTIPAPAWDTYQKSKYRDWKLKTTRFIENNDGQKAYRFECKKGVETMYLFIDKSGKVIKENPSVGL